jgi:hypothetical protein
MPHARSIAGETSDPDSVRVVLARVVWEEKIVRDHPEVALHLRDILQAVADPTHVEADVRFEDRVRYYARNVGPSRWLLVVVSYEQEPARIVSAFATRKAPKSWTSYKSRSDN